MHCIGGVGARLARGLGVLGLGPKPRRGKGRGGFARLLACLLACLLDAAGWYCCWVLGGAATWAGRQASSRRDLVDVKSNRYVRRREGCAEKRLGMVGRGSATGRGRAQAALRCAALPLLCVLVMARFFWSRSLPRFSLVLVHVEFCSRLFCWTCCGAVQLGFLRERVDGGFLCDVMSCHVHYDHGLSVTCPGLPCLDFALSCHAGNAAALGRRVMYLGRRAGRVNLSKPTVPYPG